MRHFTLVGIRPYILVLRIVVLDKVVTEYYMPYILSFDLYCDSKLFEPRGE